MQTINLDISVKSIIPLLHAKQADVGRKFKVVLSDGGKAYPLPGGAAVSVWYSGASREGNYTDVGANSAVTVSGDEIVVEMIAQMLANYGVGTMCIVIHTAGGDQLGTWNIPYMVEPLPGMGSESAKAYFTAFSKAVENLPYPDASLSVQGKAADAASVGAALATKAPAGYGLGGHAKTIYDWNTAMLNGWYRDAGNAANSPFAGAFTFGFASNYAEDCVQNVYARGGYGEDCKILHAIRMYDADNKAWGAWEYVNPPMNAGVEYRTTERWNGKAVYARLIDCGYLPANSMQYVNLGSINQTGIVGVVGCTAVAINPSYSNSDFSTLPAFYEGTQLIASADLTATTIDGVQSHAIRVVTGFDWSAYKAYATIRYTKD